MGYSFYVQRIHVRQYLSSLDNFHFLYCYLIQAKAAMQKGLAKGVTRETPAMNRVSKDVQDDKTDLVSNSSESPRYISTIYLLGKD